MNSDILISIIGFAGVVTGALFGYLGRIKKQSIQEAKREQEQSDLFKNVFEEMNAIKKKLDQHNHYAEKFGEIEKAIIAIKKDIEYIRKG